MRRFFIVSSLAVLALNALVALVFPPIWWSMVFFAPLILIGLRDMFQKKHAVCRNFPIIGNFRYFFESIRPEIAQYFIESNLDGKPFSRIERSLVYQRSKEVLDTLPFGTQLDVYEKGYEWVNHSMRPIHLDPMDFRVTIGGPDCTRPYHASRLNISAMSFGSLSGNAVLALSRGAAMGRFAHNTGEGGLSSYHLEGGADLVWQIGTGYFGCRTPTGEFCEKRFVERVAHEQVKMVEIKISQGAKPGHGGILPAVKLTKEIAGIRGVSMGKDVISPPGHSAFSTPIGLLEFVARLRELSDGKPIGIKLCVGKLREFIAVCKAMVKTGITPDFITVDGGEGGTGAAPVELSDHVGVPVVEGLIFVHNALVGHDLRDKIRIIAAGKVTTGLHMVKFLAIGADVCNSARGMMMALGCIQALKCNSNKCPVGVTTQDPHLTVGLVVPDKSVRVRNFHRQLIASACEIMGSMGIDHPDNLHPWHVMKRVEPGEVRHYAEIYDFLEKGVLLEEPVPHAFKRAVRLSTAESFDPVPVHPN